MQRKYPKMLPDFLKDWKFLPEPLRSLKPYDRVITKYFLCLPCCKKLVNSEGQDAKLKRNTTSTQAFCNNTFVNDLDDQKF